MHSTKNNSVVKKLENSIGLICRKYLKYPDQTGLRQLEGGLRLEGKNKKSLPKKPLISVITVVYNDDETLRKTVKSVLEQTYDNIEYIIIDGGSTDKTLDIIKDYKDLIDYYVSEPDEGIYSAMNKGLSLAQGDYIGLLNSGDWYENNALNIIADNINKMPGVVLAGTQKTLNQEFKVVGTRGLRFMDERVYLRMPLSHPSTFIPYHVYESIGYYDQSSFNIIADWDFIIRCYENEIKFQCVSDILINYWRVGISAQSNNSIFEEQVGLLHSRFPVIRNYDLLYLLSSCMDEKSDTVIVKALQKHLNEGGVIPKAIMMGVYLYRKQKDNFNFHDWLKTFTGEQLRCTNDEYWFSFESPSIENLIQKGQQDNLHQQQIWLINERGWDAKDNGFVFYAWLKKHHPEINAYYVISQDSTDYQKISEIDSKTVIEYNSDKHKLYYLFSKFIVSSQGGDHCHPLSYERLKTHYSSIFKSQFIFLQHGVLKNAISYFKKGHFNSSLFIISGEMERKLFESSFQYTPDDLALTGLCRFDLLDDNRGKEPYIFFMPTWRAWIKNEKDFLASKYYQEFDAFIKDPNLNQLLKEYQFKLKFFIHPNFSQYSKFFTAVFPSIEILVGEEDIGELIRECSFMISDYSSAIIDAAYMDKPILYYQPDYQEFRSSHYAETCFYSYEEHGLGSVVTSLNSLLDEISTIFSSGGSNRKKYQERSNYIFTYRDKGACQRTFDAILKHKRLPDKLSQLYTSSDLIKMGYFEVLVKDNILYLFLTIDKKSGIFVQKFTINYSLVTGEKKSQAVNLANASMTLFIEKRLVYAFTTSLPDLTASIEILGHSYELLNPILGNPEHKNVAQLGFTVRGGAGIAALRLHKGLLSSEVNSFLFQKEKTKVNAPYRVHTFENGSSNAITDWNNQQNIYAGNTIFTLSSPSEHNQHDFLNDFDILNFHWVAKYLSVETIAYLSHQDTPVVWTLHDMNPLTGGCHYFHTCNNWLDICNYCPQLKKDFNSYPAKYLKVKRKYFNFKNITIVAISNHSKEIVKKSIFKNCRIEVIPNSLEIDIFKPTEKYLAKKLLNLPLNKKIICYFPSYVSKIKGLNEAINILGLLQESRSDFHLVLAGSGSHDFNCPSDLSVTRLGHIDNNKMLAIAYSAADVTLVPSLEETFSNTTAESLACGTPVVGFKTGGIPDMITDGYNGYTVDIGDCSAFAESIEKILTGSDLSKNCRSYAENNLRLDIQASRYKKLYQELLRSPLKISKLENEIPEVFPEMATSLVYIQNEVGLQQLNCISNLESKLNSNEAMSAISSQIGVKIPAKFNNSCFKNGWSNGESWGRWTDGEEAFISLNLKDSQVGGILQAIFLIKHQIAINENFSVLVNGNITKYKFENGLLLFPVVCKKNKNIEILFQFKNITSPFEKGRSSEKRKLGIGIEWFQISREPVFFDELIRLSLPLGTRVFARFNHAFFVKGWSFKESWGRWTDGEEAIIKIYLKDYEIGSLQAVFSIKHGAAINESLSVLVNGIKIDYKFKSNLLNFPVKINEGRIIEIIFNFKNIQSPFEQARNNEKRKLGLGLEWFQFINPFV